MQVLRSGATAAVGVLLLVLAVPAAHGEAGARATATRPLAPGLSHEVWELPGSAAPVHVARRAAGSPARLQLVQARDAAHGGLETTSSMCRRTPGCRAAVNGDFFTPDGAAVGSVVVDGRMLRSPRPDHEQLSLEPLRTTQHGLGNGGWSGHVARLDGAEPLTIDGLNVPLDAGRIVLYTSRYGRSTPACTCRELRLREDGGQVGTLGTPTAVTVVGAGEGGTAVPAGTAVLAAEGAAAGALLALADSGKGALVVAVSVAEPTRHNVGAHPVVLRGGQPHPYDEKDPMLARAHPRTVVAWDAAGTLWLVAVEGRQAGSPGLTARETVAFLRRLGATEAAMLDGGGSTTFAVRGQVASTPSDGRERPVANAVLLVWQPPAWARQAAPPPPVTAEDSSAPAAVPQPPAPPPSAPAPAGPPPPAEPVVTPSAAEPARPAAVAAPAIATPPAAARRALDPLPERPVVRTQRRLPAARPPVAPAPPAPLLAAVLCLLAAGCWLRAVATEPRVLPRKNTTQSDDTATEGM